MTNINSLANLTNYQSSSTKIRSQTYKEYPTIHEETLKRDTLEINEDKQFDTLNNYDIHWYDSTEEVLVNGQTSLERSKSDTEYTYTDYGYSCFIGDTGKPYMLHDDYQKLAEECKQNGEPFCPKYLEILGQKKTLPNGDTWLMSDDGILSIGGKGKETLFFDFSTSDIPYNKLFELTNTINADDKINDYDFWNDLFENIEK